MKSIGIRGTLPRSAPGAWLKFPLLIALAAAGLTPGGAQETGRSGQQKNIWSCGYTDADIVDVWTIVETTLPATEVARQLTEASKGRRYRDFEGAYCFGKSNKGEPYASVREAEEAKSQLMQQWASTNRFRRQEWEPVGDLSPEASTSRKTATVFFRSPADDERGYSGTTFDIEYQFLACMGELHIAYSLVENSVKVGRLAGGGNRVVKGVRADKASYWHEGKVYKVGALPQSVLSLPLKGIVWLEPDTTHVIGKFADDHAAKALGFGCFSGQTKKIADLKDLTTDSGQKPTKEELAKHFDRLRVSFETVQLLTSSAAEEEIRSGLAKAAEDEYERSGQAGLDRAAEERTAGRKAAEERAARKAAEEAEFQAKQKAFEEGVAAHKAAVEQYQKALADVQAQQAAGVAQARSAQEEFARKQAEYEAEAARARMAQEEYEAKYGSPR